MAERVNSLCGEAREVSLFFKKFYLFYLFIYFIVGGNKLQVADIFFFPSLHKIKGGFLLILCYHGDTWFPLNLILSQIFLELTKAFFLMEMSSLSYVNERCICSKICLSSRFMSIVLLPGMTLLVPMLSQMSVGGEGPGATLSVLRCFPSLISSLLIDIQLLAKN